jgi:hypothetical protein
MVDIPRLKSEDLAASPAGVISEVQRILTVRGEI